MSTLPFDGLLASESTTFIHSAMIDTKLAAQSPKSSKAQIQENNIERSNKNSYFTSSRWVSKVAQLPHEIAEDDPRNRVSSEAVEGGPKEPRTINPNPDSRFQERRKGRKITKSQGRWKRLS